MHQVRDDVRDSPLFTPARSAAAFAVLVAIVLVGYLIAFGGVARLLTALGFSGSAAAGPAGANTPSPQTIADREMAELRQATYAAYNVLGEVPSSEAIADTDGVPKIDPWGGPYRYHRSPDGRQFWFSSDGPDGKPGTPDDLETVKMP